MKISQVLQSFFLGLILTGLFAMMAKNGYGYTLLGLSCFGLATLYMAQAFWKVIEDFSGTEKKDLSRISELFLLAILISLFGFRVFYITLPYSDIIFISVCIYLIALYFILALGIINSVKIANPILAVKLAFFYSSLLLFLLALGLRIINASISSIAGSLAILVSIPFLIGIIKKKKYFYSDKKISLLQFIISSGNKAGMIYLFFIFSGVYTGLSYMKIIPSIENTDKPGTYIELVNKAETGKEKPIDGRYQYEIYMDVMDKFLRRHGNSGSQNYK